MRGSFFYNISGCVCIQNYRDKGGCKLRLEELFKKKKCVFALEVFPPKKKSGIESVYEMLDQLTEMKLDYVSVTYSAGGSGATEYTTDIAGYLKNTLNIEPLAHLTCRNSVRAEIEKELAGLEKVGVENILALRGDKNPDAKPCNDFIHASDLVETIQARGGFYVAGACYPEGHPESETMDEDIACLKKKVDAGAGHLVSQLFFDNGKFFRFLNMARKAGIQCPVEAGVMPIIRKEQIERTISLSSASLPAEFSKMVTRYSDDPTGFYEAGLEYAIHQIRDLIEGGTDGIHLYAMNNAEVAKRVYEGIADLL